MEGESSSATVTEAQVAAVSRHRVPNKDLTPSQKKSRRSLKKKLKLQKKQMKLETRVRHAVSRRDPKVEGEARKELESLNQTITTSDSNVAGFSLNHEASLHPSSNKNDGCQNDSKDNSENPARLFVANTYHQLQQQQHHSLEKDEEKNREEFDRAQILLKHMTRGTQDRSMFDDNAALWGYTRQKFFERAVLVNSSFEKLHPKQQLTKDHIILEDRSKCTLAWNKLRNVRSICSVACGPGNDAVGVVAFLHHLRGENKELSAGSDRVYLDRVVLMDWAMTGWDAIVDPLKKILVPKYVQNLQSSICDVTDSLLHSDTNQNALRLILGKADGEAQSAQTQTTIDLFLFSYILSEQRGLWHTFMKDLVGITKQGALFYFSEPTPWQMHILCKSFSAQLDFVWLDSSMNFPSLQPLDNRVGPGVMLAIKR